MIEAENEEAHSAVMLVLMVMMTAACGIGTLAGTVIAWLLRKPFCLGMAWPNGW